jgi:Rieske Fe-S protein
MTHEPRRDDQHTTRRAMLAGVGLAGLAGTLAACGANGTSPAPSGGGSGAGAAALATTSEIPVGGGKIFAAQKVVVTQPSSGTFKAFSAICTHMGCMVNQVVSGTIDCPCHGSEFNIKDGTVVAGPAPSPLPAQAITVSGSNITLG